MRRLRFHGLGADAWDLIPWLALLQKDPDLAFPGAIGAIRLAADGNLIREPAWSVFSGGQATPARPRNAASSSPRVSGTSAGRGVTTASPNCRAMT